MEPKVVIVGASPEQHIKLRTALREFYFQFAPPNEEALVLLLVGEWQALLPNLPAKGARLLLSDSPYGSAITMAIADGELHSCGHIDIPGDELRVLCERVCGHYIQSDKLLRAATQGKQYRIAFEKLRELDLQLAKPGSRRETLDRLCQFATQISGCSMCALVHKDPHSPLSDSPQVHLHTDKLSDEDTLFALQSYSINALGQTHSKSPEGLSTKQVPELGYLLEIPLGDTFGKLVVCHSTPIPCESDTASLLSLVATRIGSELTRLRRIRSEERRRLELMVNSMADGLLMSELDQEEILINPAARQLLGIDSEMMVTQRYLKEQLGFYPFDLVAADSDTSEALREDLSIGDKRLHSMVSPVRDSTGRLMGVVVVLRDFTEARELVNRQEEFVAIVSHEFRTPLTSISGSLDIALSDYAGPLSDKQRQYLTMAKEGCMSLNRIVDDLLDIARSDERSMSLHWGPVDLHQLAAKATERYRAIAKSKQIDLRFTSTPSASLIRGDSSRILQVLNNLLSNALKFTPHKGKVWVEVFRPSVSSSLAGVSVYNNGAPIAEEARERIFQKFEKGHGSPTRRVGGTGLGLAISRSIVEAHGGRIWVESGKDGAQFVFTLPAGDLASESTPKVADTSEHPPTPPSTVLLVDADANSSYILKGILMSVGHEVVVTRDADSTLASARSRHPSLIVVHVAPSIGDPISLLELLKHDPDTRKTPIFIVSAPPVDASLRELAAHSLPLPIEPEHFQQECGRLLRESSSADGNRVLIVDDDPSIRSICAEVLRIADLSVQEATNGQEALEIMKTFRPDIVLLDITMPIMDGFETAEKIKADQTSSMTPIIFLSARGETNDKVKAFHIGAEDYIVKPFVTEELVARVRKALHRSHRDLGASPTTELPGGNAIAAEIEERIGNPDTAFCYLDLDNLKAYNDHYSYAKADGIIRQTGDLIRNVIATHGSPSDFIGHIAGDDFVFITTRTDVDAICSALCSSFDKLVPLYYDKDDREKGYIETYDRYGEYRRFPLMSVSIAAITSEPNILESYSALAALAATGKKQAKAVVGSSYLRDGALVS